MLAMVALVLSRTVHMCGSRAYKFLSSYSTYVCIINNDTGIIIILPMTC